MKIKCHTNIFEKNIVIILLIIILFVLLFSDEIKKIDLD